VHLDQPVDQNATHLLIDIFLGLHVVVVRLKGRLRLQAVPVDVLGLQRAVECICGFGPVDSLEFTLEVNALDHRPLPALHEKGGHILLLGEVIPVRDALLRLDLVGTRLFVLFVWLHAGGEGAVHFAVPGSVAGVRDVCE